MHTHRTLMHNVGRRRPVGPRRRRDGEPGRGADVPHHRHDATACWAPVYLRQHHGAAAALGPRTRRPADLAPPGHALDLHPDDDHRPVRQPQLHELRPVQPALPVAAAARPCRRRWRERLQRRVRHHLRRGLRPDRDRRAQPRQPARARQAAVPGHPDLRRRLRASSTPITLQELPRRRGRRDRHPRPDGLQGLLGPPRGHARRPSSRSTASPSSAPATWAAWTRRATSSSPTASSA